MSPKIMAEFEHILKNISSPNKELRREGWQQLHDKGMPFHRSLNSSQVERLEDIAFSETNSDVFQIALKALFRVTKASKSPPRISTHGGGSDPLEVVPVRPPRPTTSLLARWLWAPFLQPSAVLGVTATRYRRRDEGALTLLGRRLSFEQYGDTEFPLISLENPNLDRVLFARRNQALCMVGRLGLFGQKALARLGDDNLRFGFDKPRRPESLPVGELAPDYHSVFERKGGDRRESHPTRERDGVRTDFAVVQRYQVNLGFCTVVVVIIAGASSLGTMAAAQWAANDLYHPITAPSGTPIEVPPGIKPESRMEALLCASADVTTSAWQNIDIRLRHLSIDNAIWSLDDQKWHVDGIKTITLVRSGGRVVRILFDDQPSQLQSDGQAFRLMVAVAEQAKRSGGEIDVRALAKNDWIWDKPGPTISHVRAQLRSLRKRHLVEALRTGPNPRLLAEVLEVNQE